MSLCKCGQKRRAPGKNCLACEAKQKRDRRAAKKLPEFDIDVVEPTPPALADLLRGLPKGDYPGIPRSAPTPALRRVLIVPDTHVPYESKRAWQLMLKAAQAWKPDVIVILGDFVDFYSVSSHSKHPGRVRLLDVEVASAHERLNELDALGATEKHYISGNHEDRLERYLAEKAPELFNLIKVRDLLKLDERGWKFTPYKEGVRVGHVNFTHDVGQAGKFAFMRAMDTYQGNAVIGHVHRMGVHYEGNAKGETHVSAAFGWLGDVDQVDYMTKVNALRAWTVGFGAGWLEPNGVMHLNPVPLVDFRCVLEGVLYVG